MIVAAHHKSVQLPFEHRSNAIARQCRGLCCVELQKPLKSIALPDSTNVSKGWILSSIGDFTLLGFGQASCLRFHPVAIDQIKGPRKHYE